MKKMLALVLVAFMASGALAAIFPSVEGQHVMGFYFTDDLGAILADPTANNNATPTRYVPFNAYLVLRNTLPFVGAYEMSMTVPPSTELTVASFVGAGGTPYWTPFGGAFDHAGGFGVPHLAGGEAVVLCTYELIWLSADVDTQMLYMGPYSSASIDGTVFPAITDAENPDDIYECSLDAEDGLVATLFGETVATEGMSFSGIKALFE